jgi:hypothetical protein
MKSQLNEVQQFQKIAGILNEDEQNTAINKPSPVEKGKTTKLLNKLSFDASDEVGIALGILNQDKSYVNDMGAPDMFALHIGMHKDSNLQKKYNKLFAEKLMQMATSSGVIDKERIKKAIKQVTN